MKTLIQIDEILRKFEKQYHIQIRGAQQLSEEWFQTKLGVISSSDASKVVAKKDSATRYTYLCELVAQVCTGVIEEVNFKQTEWGRDHEDAARSSYEFGSGVKFVPMSFVFRDHTFRAGCSTDGLVIPAGETAPTKSGSIKSPWDSANYIKFLIDGDVKPEWVWQHEMEMWVLESGTIDVSQYDPRMKAKPLHTLTIERNSERQKKLDDAVPELIHDMDEILKVIGVKFGEQWSRIAKIQKESA